MTNDKKKPVSAKQLDEQQVINEHNTLLFHLITNGKYEGWTNEQLGKEIRKCKKCGALEERHFCEVIELESANHPSPKNGCKCVTVSIPSYSLYHNGRQNGYVNETDKSNCPIHGAKPVFDPAQCEDKCQCDYHRLLRKHNNENGK